MNTAQLGRAARWLVALPLILATGAFADGAPPAIRPFDIHMTEILGRAIYDQDQMAWKASDVLTAQYTMDQLQASNGRGWIVETAPDRSVVRFLHQGENGPEVFCDVTFTPQIARSCETPADRNLSSDEMAQYNARMTATAGLDRRCTERYNFVVLKDPERDGWLVWLLAATNVPGVVVYGGHYRFTISKDGKSIVQRDALSHACLTMPPIDPSQGKPVALAFSQVVGTTPVETTVWLNLLHGIPFDIITMDGKRWEIVDGHITADGAVSAKP